MQIRVCKECGKEFVSKRGHPNYCKREHYRKCVICGKDFLVPYEKLSSKAAPLCSKECVNKAKHDLALKSAKMHPKYHKNCEFCGQPFDTSDNRQRLCKRDHYLTCSVCGKEFLAKDYQLFASKKTCSKECRYRSTQESYQKHFSAESNPEAHAELIERTRQTTFENNGYYNALSPEGRILSGAADKFREKFGADHPGQVRSIMEKREQTNKEKYGNICPLVNSEIAKKSKKTLLTKYGVDNYAKSSEFLKQVITDPTKADTCKEFKDDPISFINKNFPDKKPTLIELSSVCGMCDSSIGYILDQMGHPDIVSYTYSRMENELYDFLRNLLGDEVEILRNTFQVITPYELDIYLPDYRFAIECDPTVTHNSTIPGWSKDDKPKSSTYHKMKTDMCEAKEIFLMHIFGYDWSHHSDIIKSMIASKMKKSENHLYARKLILKEVTDQDSMNFLNANHRQGGAHSSIRLGLYNEDELVSLMTFSKMRNTIGTGKSDLSNCYELVRFCSKLNTSVVGGASKLFKEFIRRYNPEEIRSFSDRAHTEGNLYTTLGFEYDHTSEPGYMWVDLKTDRGYARNNAQKNNIKSFLKDDNIDLRKTEVQIMKEHNFVQVFDSGVKLWVWRKYTNKEACFNEQINT